MSWLLNDMLGAGTYSGTLTITINNFTSYGIVIFTDLDHTYDRYPDLTGSSPILINQPLSIIPTGYEGEGFIRQHIGNDNAIYRKDISNKLEDVFTGTQRFSYRFL